MTRCGVKASRLGVLQISFRSLRKQNVMAYGIHCYHSGLHATSGSNHDRWSLPRQNSAHKRGSVRSRTSSLNTLLRRISQHIHTSYLETWELSEKKSSQQCPESIVVSRRYAVDSAHSVLSNPHSGPSVHTIVRNDSIKHCKDSHRILLIYLRLQIYSPR